MTRLLTDGEKNRLAAMLIDLDIHDLKEDENRCTSDRDFEGLKEVIKVNEAISTILEYLDK